MSGKSLRSFAVGLRVGHSLIDALENLFLRQPGIFQTPDLRAAHRPLPRQPPVQNYVHGSVRKSHQPQHDRVSTHDIELIFFGNLQNHVITIAGVRKINRRICAGKRMLAIVRIANQRHASIVAQSRLFHLYELRDFHVRSIELFQFFDGAGPHAGLVQKPIVGERMAIATAYTSQNQKAKKKEFVPHAFIVAAASARAALCAAGDTRRKDRYGMLRVRTCAKSLRARLVHALNTIDAGNLSNIREDGFELALIHDFQVGIHACVAAIGPAFQIVDIGTGATDHSGDFR